MTDILVRQVPDTTDAIDTLARRAARASGLGMRVLSAIGGQADGLVDRLPRPVKSQLETATTHALHVSVRAAAGAHGSLPRTGRHGSVAVSALMGAAGGAGGLGTALAELPLTVTFLMRVMLEAAEHHGFDADDPEIRAACVQLFALAGPLDSDDGADIGFVATRMTLTGPAVHALIARVAPKLALVLGQKLAAQAVPVLGAVAGASVNAVFTSYYREMAMIRFSLMRLSRDTGLDELELNNRLVRAIPLVRAG